jgi:two-component system NtrC family sensor kinase
MTKILIVEDELIVAMDIKGRLENLGYQVPAVAMTGQEAINEAQLNQPDMVLLDVRLKGEMDGIETAEVIRTQFRTPVLFLTALTDDETLRRAKATQPFGFLVKPFDNRDLYATIEVALHRHQLERRLERSNAFIAALSQVAARVGRTRDPGQVLEGLGIELKALGMTCVIAFLESDTQEVVVQYTSIESAALEAAEKLVGFKLEGLRLPSEAWPSGRIVESMQPVFTPDAVEVTAALVPSLPKDVVERAIHLIGVPEDNAVMYLPLVVEEQAIGFLTVWGEELRETDLPAFSVFAAQVAGTMEGVRLYSEANQRAQELDALSRAGQTIASSLDLDRVLALVTAEARILLDAEASSVLLYDSDTDELVFTAASPTASESLLGVRMPADAGIAGWVLSEREAALVSDSQRDPRWYDRVDAMTGMTTESLLAVPMMHGEEIVGVLEAMNRKGGPFEERDVYLLGALAGPAAVAIENARLFEAERVQRQLVEQSQAQLVQTEKMAALGRLIASLAHEINNPLQALRSGFSLLLSDQTSQEKRQRYLEVANQEVERLISILERVLGFVRPSSEEMAPCDVNDLLDETLLLVDKHLEEGGIAVQRNFGTDLPLLEARAGELRQVFLNLVLNALQAMPESGTLTMETGWDGTDAVYVAFSDTGLGITKDALPHMFEPFFTTRAEGSGLGLATSYGVVERYGGRIEVESVEGEGSTFTVVLPVNGGISGVDGSNA